MAYETGTATNHSDLLAKLKTFLTTNTALVAAGQQWQALRYTAGTELLLKGTGLSGTDEIFVNIADYVDTNDGIYNWIVQGAGGYVSANAVDNQPAQSPKVALSLWNNSMQYWFIANGRRFIVIAKVSSIYVAGYFGLMLPYGTPGQYPYPLFIGANIPNMSFNSVPSYSNRNYSWPNNLNSNYWCPSKLSASGSEENNMTQSLLYWVDGSWRHFGNFYTNGNDVSAFEFNSIQEDINNIAPVRPDWIRECIDGTYTLTPHQLVMDFPSISMAGELDGSFSVSGFGNGSENIITIGSDNYLVVQNVFRNSIKDFAAIKLA